ncbi:MAG: nucleotidyltransferase domain-containing protein [Chloroflexota bacterium]
MLADDVVQVSACLRAGGVDIWLDGGWGIDALVEEQTRPHDDLDMVLALDQADRAIGLLRTLGFAVAEDLRPTRLVLREPAGRQVDIHPVTFDAAGTGRQQGAAPDGGDCLYPASGFTTGVIAGQRVGCLSAAVQIAHHLGYPPDDADWHDMLTLRARLGVDLPVPYARGEHNGVPVPSTDGGDVPADRA